MPELAPDFVYVTYIAAGAERVWNGLLDPELTRLYWKHANVSDWNPGSTWQHVSSDENPTVDIVGTVVEFDAPRRMVLTWSLPGDAADEAKVSRVTFEVTPLGPDAKLEITHSGLQAASDMQAGIETGWPVVCCNLKTLLETGHTLSDEMWQSLFP